MSNNGFKELPLRIGQKVTLTVRDEKFDLAVRGWKPAHFIITDTPPFLGNTAVDQRFRPLTPCEVQLIYDGRRVVFASSVINANYNVSSYLSFAYPRAFEVIPMREIVRDKVVLPVYYFRDMLDGGSEKRGTVRDISPAGAMITVPEPLQKGASIFIKAAAAGVEEKLEAVVRNIRHNPRGEKEPWVVGVQFANITETRRPALHALIQSVTATRTNGAVTAS